MLCRVIGYGTSNFSGFLRVMKQCLLRSVKYNWLKQLLPGSAVVFETGNKYLN